LKFRGQKQPRRPCSGDEHRHPFYDVTTIDHRLISYWSNAPG
jgi:hypothetical protein